MKRLPDRVNLDHLKKQAKDLLRLYRGRDPQAIAQFRAALPAAADRSDDEIVALDLRLHDAQSCVARDYGFASWADLRTYVEAQAASRSDRATRVLRWLRLVYQGDIAGTNRSRPSARRGADARRESGSRGRRPLCWPARSATKPRCAPRRRPIPAGSTGPADR